MLSRGCREIVVDFAATETVNSIGISILLGVIDSASTAGAHVTFSGVKQSTVASRWYASKLNPKKYGDKIAQEVLDRLDPETGALTHYRNDPANPPVLLTVNPNSGQQGQQTDAFHGAYDTAIH